MRIFVFIASAKIQEREGVFRHPGFMGSCPRPATLFKKDFVKFLRTHFYIEHLWWLLLCYLKLNTEVVISEIFEKLCQLIIDRKAKE